MKQAVNLTLLILAIVLAAGCDYGTMYTFQVKNATDKTIEIRFKDTTSYDYMPGNSRGNLSTVIIKPGEEKLVREMDGPLNDPAHNCLQDHGIGLFQPLAFDTYVDGRNIESQLWLPENWVYYKGSKWEAAYKLIITSEMILKK